MSDLEIRELERKLSVARSRSGLTPSVAALVDCMSSAILASAPRSWVGADSVEHARTLALLSPFADLVSRSDANDLNSELDERAWTCEVRDAARQIVAVDTIERAAPDSSWLDLAAREVDPRGETRRYALFRGEVAAAALGFARAVAYADCGAILAHRLEREPATTWAEVLAACERANGAAWALDRLDTARDGGGFLSRSRLALRSLEGGGRIVEGGWGRVQVYLREAQDLFEVEIRVLASMSMDAAATSAPDRARRLREAGLEEVRELAPSSLADSYLDDEGRGF